MRTRRPFSVVGWTFVLLLIPFVNFVLCGIWGGEGSFFSHDSGFSFNFIRNVVLLIFCFAMAIGIFSIRQWGWWLYAGSLILLFGHNIILLLFRPERPIFWMIILNLTLALAGLILFKKQIIAPYFNADLRFQQQAKRFGVPTCLKGVGWSGQILNLSLSGCFIETSTRLEFGKDYQATLLFMNRSLSLNCRVMREVSRSDGRECYGVMFVHLGDLEFRQIERILRLLNIYFPPHRRDEGLEEHRIDRRVKINIGCVVKQGDATHNLALLDISLTGLLIKSEISIPLRERMNCRVLLGDLSFSGESSPVWCDNTDIDGCFRYGLSFEKMDRPKKKQLKSLIKRFKYLGSQYKEVDIRAYDKISDKNVLATPLRFFIKKTKE